MEEWDGERSARRLEQVQSFLEAHGKQDACLLVIPGIDGAYNPNSQRMIKYLFHGSTGDSLLEPTVSEALWEDCFLCITADTVKIYYNIDSYDVMSKYTSHWSNTFDFISRHETAEAMEQFKIETFIASVKPYQYILVGDDSQESWPLVQSYGLDRFHTGGFLSAMHKVSSFSTELSSLWSNIDNLEVVEAINLLSDWKTSIRLISKQLEEKRQPDFDSFFDPVRSSFDFGCIRKQVDSAYGGRIAFDATNELFSVRGMDPMTGVKLSRTYCIKSGSVKSELSVKTQQCGELIRAYNNVLAQINTGHLLDASRPRAEKRLMELSGNSSISVTLESFDLTGSAVDPSQRIPEFSACLYYLEVSTVDAVNMVIGDTFYYHKNKLQLVTKAAPVFLLWDRQWNAALAKTAKLLGNEFAKTNCQVILDGADLSLDMQCKIRCFQSGFLISHVSFPDIVVDFSSFEYRCSVLKDVDISDDETAISVELQQDLPELIPELASFLNHKTSNIILKTKGDSSLSDALEAWRTTGMVTYVPASIQQRNSTQANLIGSKQQEESSQQICIVTGSPASGKTAVALEIASKLQWNLVANDPLIHGISYDATRIHRAVNTSDSVVLVPGDAFPDMIKSLFPGARFYTICVVSAQNAYQDEVNLMPGFYAQSDSADVVLITGATNEAEADKLQNKLRIWNSSLNIICIMNSCLPDIASVALPVELVDFQTKRSQPFDQASLLRKYERTKELECKVCTFNSLVFNRSRCIMGLQRLTRAASSTKAPRKAAEQQRISRALNGIINQEPKVGLRRAQQLAKEKVVSVSSSSELDQQEIEEMDIPEGRVFEVSGTVAFDDAPSKFYAISAFNGHVRLVEASQSDLSLMFVGIRFTCEQQPFQNFILEMCSPLDPILPDFKGAEDMPLEASKALRARMGSEPLPSGYWFDGRSYMDHTGRPMEYHPMYQQRANEWIEEQNDKIHQHNQRVKSQHGERNTNKITIYK